MTDEQLLTRAHEGDQAAANETVRRFSHTAHAIAHRFYLPGSDRDDLQQEALIGIWNAIRSWRDDRDATARTFVALCVQRHLYTCVKVANAGKHRPLNEALRVVVNDEDDRVDVTDAIPDRRTDTVTLLTARERIGELADDLRVQLSPREARSLLLFANDLSYEEIGQRLGLPFKSVDRALTRARWKLGDRTPPSREGHSARRARVETFACPDCGARASTGTPRAPVGPVCNVCAVRQAA